MKRLPELALLVAMAVFLVAGNRLAEELPSWHEIVSALPNNPTRVLGDDGGRTWVQPSCLDEPRPRWVVSPSRPSFSMCVGDQQLPVMVTPYASGVVTWPLALFHRFHHDDTFVVRRIWLAVAALLLVLTFRLVARVADRTTAALVCIVTAASSPFVIINALLLPFETLPCTLVVAAFSCWADVARPDGPRSSRLYGGAFLAGLAIATNVKAVFLLAPILALAFAEGVRWRSIRVERIFAMIALGMTALAPLVVFGAIDPQNGLAQQLAMRGGAISENLRWDRFALEPLRLLNFASDVGSYFELATGDELHWKWMHVVVAPPLAWCAVVAIARVFGRRWGSRLSMGCGAILVTYFFVSTLLYRQIPGGNYAPLHEVFGVAIASGVVDLARLATRRASSRAAMVATSAACAMAVASVSLLFSHAAFSRSVSIAINANAERSAAAFFLAQSDAELPLYTTTYNLAGVFDALGRGRVRTIQIHDLLARCARAPVIDECLDATWRRIFERDRGPLRVVTPARVARVDKPVEVTERIDESLRRAATSMGRTIRAEGSFTTTDGVSVLVAYRLETSE